MIKEIPLLCSTPVIQSMLEGRKMQTRRLIKPQAMINEKGHLIWDNAPAGKTRQIVKNLPMSIGLKDYCPYQIGDILYVRETWGIGCRPDPFHGSVDGIEFKADGKYIDEIESLPLHFYDDFDYGNYEKSGWRPSIHMPKSIARIWLQVTDVRVERLQDISEADAISEGIEKRPGSTNLTRFDYKHYEHDTYNVSAQVSFRTLWEKINSVDSWAANPWVWKVSFTILSTTGKPDLQTT